MAFDTIYHNEKILHVAKYERESTNHEDQQKALENQCKRLDTMICKNMRYATEERHCYTERGILGRTVHDRVAINLMIDVAKRHAFVLIAQQNKSMNENELTKRVLFLFIFIL